MDESSYYAAQMGLSIFSLLFSTVPFILLIIGAIVGFIAVLALHYIEAIPVFKLAKKNGITFAWVALIPIKQCSTFVLASIPGEKEVNLLGKWSFKRLTAILIYLGVVLIGVPVVSAIGGTIGGILGLIPVLGWILAPIVGVVLGLIPGVAMIVFEYHFLRDIVDMYNADSNSAKTTTVIITIANYFTGGLVRGIYLWTLLKKQPVVQQVEAEYSEV